MCVPMTHTHTQVCVCVCVGVCVCVCVGPHSKKIKTISLSFWGGYIYGFLFCFSGFFLDRAWEQVLVVLVCVLTTPEEEYIERNNRYTHTIQHTHNKTITHRHTTHIYILGRTIFSCRRKRGKGIWSTILCVCVCVWNKRTRLIFGFHSSPPHPTDQSKKTHTHTHQGSKTIKFQLFSFRKVLEGLFSCRQRVFFWRGRTQKITEPQKTGVHTRKTLVLQKRERRRRRKRNCLRATTADPQKENPKVETLSSHTKRPILFHSQYYYSNRKNDMDPLKQQDDDDPRNNTNNTNHDTTGCDDDEDEKEVEGMGMIVDWNNTSTLSSLQSVQSNESWILTKEMDSKNDDNHTNSSNNKNKNNRNRSNSSCSSSSSQVSSLSSKNPLSLEKDASLFSSLLLSACFNDDKENDKEENELERNKSTFVPPLLELNPYVVFALFCFSLWLWWL